MILAMKYKAFLLRGLKFILGAANIYLLYRFFIAVNLVFFFIFGLRIENAIKYAISGHSMTTSIGDIHLPKGFSAEEVDSTSGDRIIYKSIDYHGATLQFWTISDSSLCDHEAKNTWLKFQGFLNAMAFPNRFYGVNSYYTFNNYDVFMYRDFGTSGSDYYAFNYFITVPQKCTTMILAGPRIDNKLALEYARETIFLDAKGDFRLNDVF